MTASLLRTVDSVKAQPFGAVVAIAGVATPSREMSRGGAVSGQTSSARGDQGVFVSTFELSPSLLKSLIISSRSLSEKVDRDAKFADSHQLSTTWEGLVLRRKSQILVPDDVDLQRQITAEYHDTPYAGHWGIDKDQKGSWSVVLVAVYGRRCR